MPGNLLAATAAPTPLPPSHWLVSCKNEYRRLDIKIIMNRNEDEGGGKHEKLDKFDNSILWAIAWARGS
jgi:hypothetical protein